MFADVTITKINHLQQLVSNCRLTTYKGKRINSALAIVLINRFGYKRQFQLRSELVNQNLVVLQPKQVLLNRYIGLDTSNVNVSNKGREAIIFRMEVKSRHAVPLGNDHPYERTKESGTIHLQCILIRWVVHKSLRSLLNRNDINKQCYSILQVFNGSLYQCTNRFLGLKLFFWFVGLNLWLPGRDSMAGPSLYSSIKRA